MLVNLALLKQYNHLLICWLKENLLCDKNITCLRFYKILTTSQLEFTNGETNNGVSIPQPATHKLLGCREYNKLYIIQLFQVKNFSEKIKE